MKTKICNRVMMLMVTALIITAASSRLKADTGTCSGAGVTLPFTDVMGSPFFCNIAEAYFTGLTNGTSANTYSPSQAVTREQMSAFVTRTLDQSVKRESRRAALDQFWVNQGNQALGLTRVGDGPRLVASDGEDLWVANESTGTVSRVRASDGKQLAHWTGASYASGVLVANGKVYVTGAIPSSAGRLYQIDPTQPPGAVTILGDAALGESPRSVAFDGQRIWTANFGSGTLGSGSVSVVTLDQSTVVNNSGFGGCTGIVYDGSNMWVTDYLNHSLVRMDSNGFASLPLDVGAGAAYPCFDGINIWVPNLNSNSVSVVRATGGLAGTVLATLTGNGLASPTQAAFDGERILITNGGADSVSLWKASDLTPIGSFSTGANTSPFGVCSDGLNFWITLYGPGNLARF
jgi:hypothetical protein